MPLNETSDSDPEPRKAMLIGAGYQVYLPNLNPRRGDLIPSRVPDAR